MPDAAAAVASWLAAAFVVQLGLVLGYRSASRRREESKAPVRLPRFGVIMPVRGLDPELPAALESLLAQDYPSFDLHVVVDRRSDPAWAVVVRAVGSAANARVHALENRRPTCSLVCSSLLQTLDRLDPTCELIAFAASDLVAPRDWLSRLAEGMRDDTVGGTLGNRWYVPSAGLWGSVVRQQWNAGAVVLMRLLAVPWAGGLALRRRDVDALGLREVWERSLVEDLSVLRAMKSARRPFRKLPGLLVANRDEIDLRGAFRFIRRQLLWARLYHPAWPLILAHALSGSATLVAPLILALLFIATGRAAESTLPLAAAAVYVAALAALLVPMESAVRTVLRGSGQEPQRWTARLALRSLLAVPLSQLIYTAAAIHAAASRSISWRGVVYAFDGPYDVLLVSDDSSSGADGAGLEVS